MRVDSTRGIIARAIAEWGHRLGVRPRTRAKRAAHLEVLFGPRMHSIRPLAYVRRGTTTGPGVGTWEGDPLFDGLPTGEWETRLGAASIRVPEDGAAEGEGPVDYCHPGVLVTSPAGPHRPPAHDRWSSHRLITARLGFRHDPSTAQPFEYAALADHVFRQRRRR